MAYKSYILDDGQVINIYKKRNNKSLKLTISADGKVRVSIPAWTPYKVGLEFAKSKHNWIISQKKPDILLESDQAIGKAHRLKFKKYNKINISSKVTNTEIIINLPKGVSEFDTLAQKKAKVACIRALRREAEDLLPQRLESLAKNYGFIYNKVDIKQLKGRWGSCDNNQNIVLNLFLIQLPWHLIDYVLIHELTHTKIMKHGPEFWSMMLNINSKARTLSKEIKSYQPVVSTFV